ncbi:MAG: transcriptional regulator [Spirosomaceae bacterium]|jgi:HTH-type transcriptional regulator/antitoxin HigA|nr:transcriptional regulator [Spirosomataceae bacterium]
MHKILKNEEDYRNALRRIDEIFDAAPNTSEGEEAELLVLLVKDYENKNHPVLPLDPIEAIKLTLEEKGLKAKDLVGIIGSKGYVSQVLNRKKPLTAEMMRVLHRQLNIPADILLT